MWKLQWWIAKDGKEQKNRSNFIERRRKRDSNGNIATNKFPHHTPREQNGDREGEEKRIHLSEK